MPVLVSHAIDAYLHSDPRNVDRTRALLDSKYRKVRGRYGVSVLDNGDIWLSKQSEMSNKIDDLLCFLVDSYAFGTVHINEFKYVDTYTVYAEGRVVKNWEEYSPQKCALEPE